MIKLRIRLVNGDVFEKEVHKWSPWGDGLIGFDKDDKVIIRGNGESLATIEVVEDEGD